MESIITTTIILISTTTTTAVYPKYLIIVYLDPLGSFL